MRRAASEIGHWGEYDYVLINEDMDARLAEVRSIIEAGRLDFVRRLVERPNY